MSHQTISDLNSMADEIFDCLDQRQHNAPAASNYPLLIDDSVWDSMITWFGDPFFTVPELNWAAQ